MNRSFIVAVLTVTMFIMMASAGYALTAPHSLVCDNCHGKFVGSDRAVSAANSCVTCHSAQGEAQRMPVESDAMSNFFGSYTANQPSTGSRSTHTWRATSPSGPTNSSRAKVVDSLNPTLASGYNGGSGPVPLSNTTLCIRCHNVKGTDSTLGQDKPFLRIPSANDALCYECHLSRKTNTQATGSHPVSYRAYSSVYMLNTTAFRKVPISANPYNPTANPGNYLSGGQVVCSTCHAPHYADSSSATFGNRSTANGFANYSLSKGLKNQLQNSKGQLLRTDPVGATANAINVCSSCHKETKNLNHNGKGQNVQCDHCHGAHVDYTGDGSLPNLYLVRRDFSNISIAAGKNVTAGKKAIYNTVTSLRFMRADNKGICQVCHTPTPGVAIHDQSDTRREDCLACHKHSNGFAAADCTTCHGQPPMTSYVGGPKGKSSKDYSLDESYTPHATHADAGYYKFACKNCHYDGTRADSHNTLAKTGSATFDSVFVETAGSVGDLAGFKNIATDYNKTTRTCSNVYCHSNGNPRGGVIDWKSPTHETPSWENGKNKILGQASECSTCHEYGATLTTNAHFKHATTNNISCNVCHAATVTQYGAIADRTKHANGTKDVVFVTRPTNFLSVFQGSFDPVTATCTASCHTNGLGSNPITVPKWTDAATGQCGSCHAAIPATSLHSMHFTDTIGPKLGTAPTVCANCHVYSAGAATHANGVVDLRAGNSCSPCHPSAAPIWSTGSTVTCESCHTGTASNVLGAIAPLKDLNKTIGHGQYSSATLHVTCTSCHNAAAAHIGAGSTEKRLLVAGNGLCNTCHISSVMKNMSTTRANMFAHGGSVNNFSHYTSASDLANAAAVRSDACAGCHDTHGTTNLHNVRTVINGQTVSYTNNSTGFRVTVPNGNGVYNGLCQICHTKTKYFNNNAPPVLGHNGGRNCLSCHKHKTATFAFAPVGGGCSGCHGYPPVKSMTGFGTMGNYTNAKFQDYSGGGGAHSVAGHISKTVIESEREANCTNCHSAFNISHNQGGTPVKKSFVNVVVDPKFKFNNATSITYSANSCSNVSCHFKPSPNWTTGL